MNQRCSRAGRLFSLLLALLAACSTPESDGAAASPTSDLPLAYLRTEVHTFGTAENPYDRALDVLRLTNATAHPFTYFGQNPSWAAYAREVRTEGTWEPTMYGMMCATGFGTQTIDPGVDVELFVHSTRTIEIMRGGEGSSLGRESRVCYWLTDAINGEKRVVWSAPYSPVLAAPR